jgi:hypothetical protein
MIHPKHYPRIRIRESLVLIEAASLLPNPF